MYKLDDLGNKYIADRYNHVIRKINTTGIITTIAGNGHGSGTSHGGYSGDGGPATNAELSEPSDLAFDALGNLYIAEFGNSVIRKVNILGIISTYAGTGGSGFSGDGGPASSAKLSDPIGLVFDSSGNLYFSNNGAWVVRKINTSGIISTIAGNGTLGYSGDSGLATTACLKFTGFLDFDSIWNLHIPDYGNYRIRKVDALSNISTVAGNGTNANTGDGGPATASTLGYIWSVLFDQYGNNYISDYVNPVIRKINAGGIISTIAGTGFPGYSGDGGPAISAQLNTEIRCSDVDVFSNLYISDPKNNRIRRLTYNTSGIENANEIPAQLSIYPNPGCKIINIANATKIETIAISDVLGHKLDISSTSIGDKEIRLNVEQLPVGVYFVIVNGVHAGKFVKQYL